MRVNHQARMGTRFMALLVASLHAGQMVAWQQSHIPAEMSPQPLPFSHRLHADLGIKCLLCHTTARAGPKAGLPTSSVCLLCHTTATLEESQQTLLEHYRERGGSIPWKRHYVLQEHTFFSHRHHLEGGAQCRECHGEVAEKETLMDEKPLTMAECVGCHLSTGVPVECGYCHGTLIPESTSGEETP